MRIVDSNLTRLSRPKTPRRLGLDKLPLANHTCENTSYISANSVAPCLKHPCERWRRGPDPLSRTGGF